MNQSPVEPVDPKAIARSRLKLILVFTLFLGPLILAFIWYYGLGAAFAPKGAVNNALLIQPPKPVAEFTNLKLNEEQVNVESLRGRWTVVHRLGQACDDDCVTSLYNTRQTRLALGRNSNRVQRLLLGSDVNLLEEVGKNHQDLGLVLNVPGGLNAQLDNLAAEGHAAGPDDAFLIDPLGNLMMVIPVELDPSLLLKDLKKLLKLSRVG